MLPVLTIRDDILRRLRERNRLVLSAPTGSGKTTQTPQIMLRDGGLAGRIVVLQPRRLATRMVATRVAEELGEAPGKTVGYVTRHERAVSDQSRIIFMTEGLLLRRLQDDPKLAGIDMVILDEFHERSLAADMALALLKRLQRQRTDLRLMVMSATLDVESVAAYLDCPSLEAHGRQFPVAVSHLAKRSPLPVWELAAEALRDIADDSGDILIFMPGVFEIRRTIEAARRVLPQNILLLPLHGSLTPAEQDRAVRPAKERRIIVATNVAETSITIDGIRHVIDSGVARIHRYDPARDINVLRVEPISRASADQRAGRAGRTAPGTCMRLWTQTDHHQREAQTPPEVRRVELSQAMLQLKDMGVADAATFDWLEAPAPESLARAEALLHSLGAVDSSGALTPRGRSMAAFPEHPRVARMLMEASARGCLHRATLWAAILAERDVEASGPAEPGDVSDLQRLERVAHQSQNVRRTCQNYRAICRSLGLLTSSSTPLPPREGSGEGRASNRPPRDSRRETSNVPPSPSPSLEGRGVRHDDTPDLIHCLLTAFPDHVALVRDARKRICLMPGRRRVALDKGAVIHREGLILALDVTEIGRGDTAQTMLALITAIEPEQLAAALPHRVTTQVRLAWDDQHGVVHRITERCYDGLAFEQSVSNVTHPAEAEPVLVEQIVSGKLKLEHWDEAVEAWIDRVRCVAAWFPERELMAYSDDDKRVILHEIVAGGAQWSHVRDRPCIDAVRNALSWDDQQFVDRMAPTQIAMPTGWKMKLTYKAGEAPRGKAKIQDFYDVKDTPRVAGGRVKVLLEILGPNYRPVQVTDDLAGFWERLYPELKKNLKRRYPRQEWR